MGTILTAVGILLLVVCLAGIALGAYMASGEKNREPGVLFAAWWVSGAAGALGVAMRDGVTFLVGAVCFVVAGAVFLLAGGGRRAPSTRDRGGPRGGSPEGSEKTTKENPSGYRRAAS